jgi:prophage regulatory protein
MDNETGFLRLKDVLKLYPVSKSAWYAGIAAGRHPRPVKLGGAGARTSAWRRVDIRALLESTAAEGAAQ